MLKSRTHINLIAIFLYPPVGEENGIQEGQPEVQITSLIQLLN